MALLKRFTDSCGNEFEQAHFRCVQINISAADKNVNLVFYGYRDLDSFTAGKQPLPGAVKSYAIAGSDFLALASSAPVGATLYDVLAHASEHYAVNKADVETGEVDSDGKKILVSYFAGATQV